MIAKSLLFPPKWMQLYLTSLSHIIYRKQCPLTYGKNKQVFLPRDWNEKHFNNYHPGYNVYYVADHILKVSLSDSYFYYLHFNSELRYI